MVKKKNKNIQLLIPHFSTSNSTFVAYFAEVYLGLVIFFFPFFASRQALSVKGAKEIMQKKRVLFPVSAVLFWQGL